MKKLLLLLTVTLLSLTSFAQTTDKQEMSKFPKNSYIQINGGEIWSLKQDNLTWKTITPVAGIKYGMWFTPILGAQLDAEAGFGEGQKTAFDHTNISGNAVISLTNLLFGSKDRVVDVNLIGGAGWYHTYGTVYNSLSTKGGFEVNFNITNKLQFNIIPEWTYITKGGKLDNSYIGLKGGITYKFGKAYTTKTYYNPEYVNELNDEINELRIENSLKDRVIASLKDRPNVIQIQKELILVENGTYILGFDINSAEIKTNQLASLEYLVNILNTTDRKIVISGYADRETGDRIINERLSIKRAIDVANYLTNRGIAKNRISTKGYGDIVQPFKSNNLNRVVIINLTD